MNFPVWTQDQARIADEDKRDTGDDSKARAGVKSCAGKSRQQTPKQGNTE